MVAAASAEPSLPERSARVHVSRRILGTSLGMVLAASVSPLAAQSLLENMPLITNDPAFTEFHVKTFW